MHLYEETWKLVLAMTLVVGCSSSKSAEKESEGNTADRSRGTTAHSPRFAVGVGDVGVTALLLALSSFGGTSRDHS